MTHIYLLIVTIISWGIGQTLLKIGFSKSTPISSFLLGGIFGIFVGGPYMVYSGLDFTNFSFFFPMTLFIVLTNLTYYYALNAGELSVASAILGTYPMYTVLFAVLMLGEALTNGQIVGLVLVITGVGILSVNPGGCSVASSAGVDPGRAASASPAASKIWLFLSILSAVLIGIGDAVSKFVVTHTGPATFMFYFGVIQISVGIILKLVFERGRFNIETVRSKYSIMGLLLLNIGGLAFTIALSIGQASIIVPMSSTYLAIVTLLSWWFLNERFNIAKGLAIAMIIAGVLMLG